MADNEKKKRGGFFVLEKQVFHNACDQGLQSAIALLVLSRFSNRKGDLTRASANAIEKYTGIGRSRAHEAIKRLEDKGIVRRLGSRTRPRYSIATAESLPDPRGTLEDRQIAALERAVKGEKLTRSEQSLLTNMERAGWVRHVGAKYEAIPRDSSDPLWLPNELVDGIPDAPAPVERVRQTGDVLTLRLFVDLYSAHRLDEWHGVNPELLWLQYDEVFRQPVGSVILLAWEPSRPGGLHARRKSEITSSQTDGSQEGDKLLFERIDTLGRLGLLQFVPHVVDGGGAVVYPCPQTLSRADDERGLPIEREVGAAARAAAGKLLPFERGSLPCGAIVAVVPRHMGTATLIGIARLTFRPKTAMTAAWLSDLSKNCARWIQTFEDRDGGTGAIAKTG